MKHKYTIGIKGRGMCKKCSFSIYSEVLKENYCTFWNCNLYSAVKICKGVVSILEPDKKIDICVTKG